MRQEFSRTNLIVGKFLGTLEGAGRGARGLHSVHDHTDAVVDGERNRALPGHADRHGGREGEEKGGFLLPGGSLPSDERGPLETNCLSDG